MLTIKDLKYCIL